MAFRLGLAGLCTSHPENWVPIIHTMADEGLIDAEISACWDSAETRPPGFAEDFAAAFEIAHAVEQLEDMIDLVDGVIVHTTNWDRHVEQARPFVEAGKSVLLDKPVVGNMPDVNQLLDWAQTGARITGGSSLRYAAEVREFLARPAGERGEVHTAFVGCGVDDFNYGIHAYALACGLMGPGVRSVQYLGASAQKHIRIKWANGAVAFLAAGTVAKWLPFYVTAVTERCVEQITVDNGRIYRALLEAVLPYLTGSSAQPPLTLPELLEPELAALAARRSWLSGGAEVFLTDLRHDDEGYDGTEFARGYLRARLGR